MLNKDCISLIRTRLSALSPTNLEIKDESYLHIGHKRVQEKGGHYHISIASALFEGISTLARHRLVYEHIHDLIPYPIHALTLDVKGSKNL